VGWRWVTPDYFSVLNIPLLRGRTFEESDRRGGAGAIILNEALALRLFPGEEPLGQTIRFPLGEQRFTAALAVVGVTGNTQNQGLGGHAGPEYYVVRRHAADDMVFRYPDAQRVSIAVRSVIEPQIVANELRRAVGTLDSTLPVETATLDQTVFRLAARPRFSAVLLTLFAGIGLLVAAAGVYGVVSLLVGQRTQEIAIRVALGANPSSVMRMIVAHVLTWIGLGTAAGILSALIAARWVESLLFAIKPNDPKSLVEAAITLMAVAFVAAYIPARRAAKVDPMVALRYE
jgi:hypothetical protein